MIHLVDFHCHLDLYPDYKKVIEESEAAKVYTLAVTTTPRAWKRNCELTEGLQYVRPALGLHPQLIGKGTAEELKLWEHLLPQTRYIGEVGIDAGPAYAHTLEEQKRVFARILTLCAKEGNKILSVHAAHSTGLVLDLIEKYFPSSEGTIILHWFSGTMAQARRAVRLGCYFSVNTAMLGSKNGQVIIQGLPTDRIMIETDGPFIEINGKPARPKDVIYTIERLSDLIGFSPEKTSEVIAKNLKNIVTI